MGVEGPGICPHCGYSLKRDEVIHRGDWTLDPRGEVFYRGRKLRVQVSLAEMLHSIAVDAPRPCSISVIANRLGIDEGASVSNTVKVRASQLRNALRAADIDVPFEVIYGRGYRWTHNAVAA